MCWPHLVVQEIKSKEEVQIKDQNMQAKIIEIKMKWKRGPYKGTEARQATKKQQQLEAREEILALASPVGRMTTLRELHILKIKEA
jgi:hypothetical protein